MKAVVAGFGALRIAIGFGVIFFAPTGDALGLGSLAKLRILMAPGAFLDWRVCGEGLVPGACLVRILLTGRFPAPGEFLVWIRFSLAGSAPLGLETLTLFALGGVELILALLSALSSSVSTLVNLVIREAGLGEFCLDCRGEAGLEPPAPLSSAAAAEAGLALGCSRM